MNVPHGGTVFAVARSLGVAPEEILDFSASINPLGPAPGVRQALADAFDRLVHYPDSDCTQLREALAADLGIAPASILPANGSTELIYLVPRFVPGHRALIVAPAFGEYERALELAGWQSDFFFLDPADGFRLPLDRLTEKLAEGFDLLIFGNPGNPTGCLWTREEVEGVLETAERAGIFTVVDEAFIDFCAAASVCGTVATRGRGVVLRSLTKFYGIPGLRLGYAVGSPSVIGRLAEFREPWSVNTLAQTAGIASLAAAGYRRETLRLVAGEREFLGQGLASLPGVALFPAAANYLLLKVEGGMSAPMLADRLRQERILVRDCSTFRGLDRRFIRIAVRGRTENERLLAALRRILSTG